MEPVLSVSSFTTTNANPAPWKVLLKGLRCAPNKCGFNLISHYVKFIFSPLLWSTSMGHHLCILHSNVFIDYILYGKHYTKSRMCSTEHERTRPSPSWSLQPGIHWHLFTYKTPKTLRLPRGHNTFLSLSSWKCNALKKQARANSGISSSLPFSVK